MANFDLCIVGRDSKHKELLEKAFPEAYVITPHGPLVGHAFKKIICIGLEFSNESDAQMFKEWYETALTIKLLPDNGGIHIV